MIIPSIEPPIVRKVESIKKFACPSTINFFHLVLPLFTQLFHFPTYLVDFAMAKPISLLN
jgi:hypothetical protein